jgi:DUF971 family protein
MTKITIFALLIFQLTNLLAQDTIPFSIGDNNKIYIKARINNSAELNLMYDTGADICAIKKSILDKTVTIKIDGNEENVGVGGTSIVETSSKNEIKINTISKKAQKLVVLDYEDEFEDGIIGWTYFEDKIVYINYGIRKIIIYDKLPEIPKEYIKLKCKKIDNLYFIQLTLIVKGKKIKDWYELDTGSDGSLSISNLLGKKRSLFGKMTKIGSSESVGSDNNVIKNDLVLLDELRLKNYKFYRIPINLAITESLVENNDIIGNNFLKRFHIYTDFKNNEIYLKVNNLVHSHYIESLIK